MRILLADDHPLFLEAVESILSANGLTVVGTARDGEAAVAMARHLKPDVVLMDIRMPKLDGLAATRMIRQQNSELRVVILSMCSDDDALFEAVRSGAVGYLLKTMEGKDFVDALRNLMNGETVLSAGLAERILRKFGMPANPDRTAGAERSSGPDPTEPLSPRQIEVLTLVARGLSYKEVAGRLHLSPRTIKYHVAETVERLQLRSRAEAIEFARSQSWYAPDPVR
jgi:DNA-binding NarL/FixJ family response regulator